MLPFLCLLLGGIWNRKSKCIYNINTCISISDKLPGTSWLWSYGSWIYNYLCNQCLSPLKLWVRILLMAKFTRYNIIRIRTLYDKVYQWLATIRWFSPGTPVSFTNKTDRHDITEILLKVASNTTTLTLINYLKQNDIFNFYYCDKKYEYNTLFLAT